MTENKIKGVRGETTSADRSIKKMITSKSIKPYVCRIANLWGDAALTLAFAAVGRVSMVTRHACLAVGTSGEVTALFAHAAVHTRAVAITLACCGRNTEGVMD